MIKTTRRGALKLGLASLAIPFTAGTAKAASHAVHVVQIRNMAFQPSTLQMQAGDRVTFVNMDAAPHTATADNGSFDTGRLGRGDEATLQIVSAGTYSFFCAVHPTMRGQIIAS